jgi:bZIP transcription factor
MHREQHLLVLQQQYQRQQQQELGIPMLVCVFACVQWHLTTLITVCVDNLLTYFLGGDPTPPLMDHHVYAGTSKSSATASETSKEPAAQTAASKAEEDDDDDDEDDDDAYFKHAPPQTPFPPLFYGGARKTSTADDSITSAMASLISQPPQDSRIPSSSSLQSMNSTQSPLMISPAQWMTANSTSPENLLFPDPKPAASSSSLPVALPAPPTFQQFAGATAEATIQQQHGKPPAPADHVHPIRRSTSQQESYMNWLRDLNAAAATTTSASQPLVAPPPPEEVKSSALAPPPVVYNNVPPGVPAVPVTLANGAVGYFPVALLQSLVNSPSPAAGNRRVGTKKSTQQHRRATSPKEQDNDEVETAEKRAKRLERNRESARKSRARKKERLAALSAQVDQLHTQLEGARKVRVHGEMMAALGKCRQRALIQLSSSSAHRHPQDVYHELVTIIRNTSASAHIFVAEFQYNALRQLVLPRHVRFLLWLLLQNDRFFSTGKEEYVKRREENPTGNHRTGKAKAKPAPIGRVSSKQVGEDITRRAMEAVAKNTSEADDLMGPCVLENGDDMATSEHGSSNGGGGGNGGSLTSYSSDSRRMWPLFAYEIQFSVEHEDRILTARRTIPQQLLTPEQLLAGRVKAVTADQAVENVRGAMESLCRVVSQREERSLLGTLQPAQVTSFSTWLTEHRARLHARAYSWSETAPPEAVVAAVVPPLGGQAMSTSPTPSSNDPYSATLTELCKKLQAMLQVSSKAT